jgi:hypothetical protein
MRTLTSGLREPDRIGLGSSGEQRRGRQHGSRRRDCKQCGFHCRSSLGFSSHPNEGSTKSFRTRAAEPLRDIDLILLRPMFWSERALRQHRPEHE